MANDCIDILRSIGATCISLNQIGGVDKRVWVTQLNQIESYTFDSNGYVNSLVTKEINTTNYRYELAQIIGKKNTHSGNYEGVVGENVSFVKHNAVLKIYTDSPSDRDKVIDLFDAQEIVILFENSNGKIELYGLEKGLDGSALVGGTGTEMQDDTAVTITLTGDQNKLPYFFLYGGSLATSIEYLDSIGLNPIYEVHKYSTGVAPFTFIPNGSNGWNIHVVANPTTVQIPSGETIDSVHVEVLFWNAGSDTTIHDASVTTDTTINTGANGAGMYEVLLTYNVSGGSQFLIFALIVVDATNTILAYYKMLGVAVSNVNGLNIDVDADISQSGTLSIDWIALDGITQTMVGSGNSASLSLLPTTVVVGQKVTLDSNFSDYPNAEYFSGFSVSIN